MFSFECLINPTWISSTCCRTQMNARVQNLSKQLTYIHAKSAPPTVVCSLQDCAAKTPQVSAQIQGKTEALQQRRTTLTQVNQQLTAVTWLASLDNEVVRKLNNLPHIISKFCVLSTHRSLNRQPSASKIQQSDDLTVCASTISHVSPQSDNNAFWDVRQASSFTAIHFRRLCQLAGTFYALCDERGPADLAILTFCLENILINYCKVKFSVDESFHASPETHERTELWDQSYDNL